MGIEIKKLQLPQDKLDVNLSFYFFLKHLVKSKLTDNQVMRLIQEIESHTDYVKALDVFRPLLGKAQDKQREYDNLVAIIDASTIDIFLFALRLYLIKDLLLSEAKIGYITKQSELSQYDLLSLSYDKHSLMSPYSMRVNGALLSLIFFEKIEEGQINLLTEQSISFLQALSKDAKSVKLKGVEPNQIFMLMFSESINQSITSASGYNYEERIEKVLNNIGIPSTDITKTHDNADKSTEYDFFFTRKNKTFGIGAKKTLRERYKQFIKTSLTSEIDVSIEITLGLDLNEEKAKTIRQHGTVIFVADEIYMSRKFLQQMDGIYSTQNFNLTTLDSLANKTRKNSNDEETN
jgi:hypothetical protein